MWIVLFRVETAKDVIAPCWRLFPTRDEARAYAATILASHPGTEWRMLPALHKQSGKSL